MFSDILCSIFKEIIFSDELKEWVREGIERNHLNGQNPDKNICYACPKPW